MEKKITEAMVKGIYSDIMAGVKQANIARSYNVNKSLVSHINSMKDYLFKEPVIITKTLVTYKDPERNFWERLIYLFKGE